MQLIQLLIRRRLIQLRLTRMMQLSRSGAQGKREETPLCIVRLQMRRWYCFRMTTTLTCSRSLFGNRATPAGSCMAHQPQAQVSWVAWRQACLSSPRVRTPTTRQILASR